jgi:hypothetical protein
MENPLKILSALILALALVHAAPLGGPTSTLTITPTQVSSATSTVIGFDLVGMTFGNYPYITVVGLSAINVGFGNWTMVPSPDVVIVGMTDGNQADSYHAAFPAGLPVGTHVYVQCWQDATVEPPAHLWEGSNAVELLVVP